MKVIIIIAIIIAILVYLKRPKTVHYTSPTGMTYNLFTDMLAQPHLLIAGATGSGKSVVINGLVDTLMYRLPFDKEGNAQLILLDPKKVELLQYKFLPHTLAHAAGYRRIGWQAMHRVSDESRRKLIERYKAAGRAGEIQTGLRELTESFAASMDIPEKFAFVEGKNLEDYLHDMKLVQRFAALNREAMTRTILEGMGLTELDRFTTIHNYIDTEHRILRKGSVSAQKGERLLIPINMRDGALICVGKGNEEWNCSAPPRRGPPSQPQRRAGEPERGGV